MWNRKLSSRLCHMWNRNVTDISDSLHKLHQLQIAMLTKTVSEALKRLKILTSVWDSEISSFSFLYVHVFLHSFSPERVV